MKILFFHRWVGVHEGGTETHIKELASFMVRREHEVSILTNRGKALDGFDSRANIFRLPLSPLESPYSYKSMYDPRLWLYTGLYTINSLMWLLIGWLRGRRFDVISAHFLVESKIARMYRYITKTPYIFVIEGYTDLEAREAKHADLVMASSQHEVDECFKNCGYKPVLKPHGVDLKRFHPEADVGNKIRSQCVSKDEKLVLTVCRLEPRKDLPTLIKAAKIVVGKNPRAKFVIVGEGISSGELRGMVAKEGLDEFVKFAGRVSEEDLPKYYAAADLYVLPTLYEGFGIVYLEAMASGCPVLSTKVGAVPEVVGSDGVLIEPKKPELLAEKILEILANERFRQELINRGLKKVREKYDREELLKIFEEAVGAMLMMRIG